MQGKRGPPLLACRGGVSRYFGRGPRGLEGGQKGRQGESEKLTGGEVGLYEHLSGGHEVGVGVRVETGGGDHELHEGGVAPGRVKLESGCRSATLVGGVDVGHVPVDVPAAGEATDECDGAIAERLCGRVPACLLHGEDVWVVEPLTGRVGHVGGGARVEYADGLSAVIVVVHVVIVGRRWRSISFLGV